MESETKKAPFHLSGNFAPVLEERTVHALEVVGELPADLRGTYVRNGPNPRSGTSPAWFAGEGMLHGVRLEGGSAAWYRNRWFKSERKPNTNVVRHAGHILALVETQLPVEVDGELETIGTFDFGGDLRASMTAHPKVCPRTGELVFFSYGKELPHVTFYRAREGRIVHAAPIHVPKMTYMHDFAITERRAVFYDLPVFADDWRSPQPLRWEDGYPARIGVLPRDGGNDDMRWFDVKPCMIGHTLNAYDDGDTVVLDVTRSPRIMTPTELYRYTFDLRTGAATETVLDARFVEFPRVHPGFEGRPYRYGYTVELTDLDGGIPHRSIARKYEVATGVSKVHEHGPGRSPGECVIAPRAGGVAEDDAWAIMFVYDTRRNASDSGHPRRATLRGRARGHRSVAGSRAHGHPRSVAPGCVTSVILGTNPDRVAGAWPRVFVGRRGAPLDPRRRGRAHRSAPAPHPARASLR